MTGIFSCDRFFAINLFYNKSKTNYTSIHRIFFLSLVLLGTFFLPCPNSFASSLQEGRSNGVFGETENGYIALVQEEASASFQTLMKKINAARRADFTRIAAKNNISIQDAGKIAAQKIIQNLPSGSYYKGPNGQWVQK